MNEYNIFVEVNGKTFTRKFKALCEDRAIELCRDVIYNDALDDGETEGVAFGRSEGAKITAVKILN